MKMEVEIHKQAEDQLLKSDPLIKLAQWLCKELNLPIVSLDIIFTDDSNLRSMHKRYLDDNSNTDVMTFNLGTNNTIEGEIYISTERAHDNAVKFKVAYEDEINRLIIHACLHLAGYQDLDVKSRRIMKEKEDALLELASHTLYN